MALMEYVAVGLGGCAGAMARYGLGSWMQRISGDGWPAGTLFVNLAGCFLIGALSAIADGRIGLPDHARLLLITGLLGSFTTFSTFGKETLELFEAGRHRAAIGYAAVSVVIGVGAVVGGRLAARSLGA